MQNDFDGLAWYSTICDYPPQYLTIAEVVLLLQVDEAQAPWIHSLTSTIPPPAYFQHHMDCRFVFAKGVLLFWTCFHRLAVVAEPVSNHLKKNLAPRAPAAICRGNFVFFGFKLVVTRLPSMVAPFEYRLQHTLGLVLATLTSKQIQLFFALLHRITHMASFNKHLYHDKLWSHRSDKNTHMSAHISLQAGEDSVISYHA